MLRGERFQVDLGQDDEPAQSTVLPGAFVHDVLERKPAAPKPPTTPTLKSKTGFPEHGARKTESRFEQRLNAKPTEPSKSDASKTEPPLAQDGPPSLPPPSGKALTWEEEEKARIDRENNERLAEMSSAEIEQERRELMQSLSPEIMQKLLGRSSIESGSAESDLARHCEPMPGSSMKQPRAETEGKEEKKVAFAEDVPEPESPDPDDDIEDEAGEGAETLEEDAAPLPREDSIHFPRPSQPPDLDPSSDNFLTDLHDKYFPSLPSDPEKLEWMQQPSNSTSNPSSDKDAASKNYSPTATGIEPKDLRFDFKGRLIPPSTAASIPVTAGLHHHGDAPEAAGYTIPELSHLSRSSYAPQRCVAFQTLGRILFRLGRGEYGDASEPSDVVGAEESLGALARGLWRVLCAEKMTEMLVRESEGRGVDGGRHLSARAYATEAVWLWQRGGGRRMGAE